MCTNIVVIETHCHYHKYEALRIHDASLAGPMMYQLHMCDPQRPHASLLSIVLIQAVLLFIVSKLHSAYAAVATVAVL